MPPVRPILDTFLRTPWVANTPVDDTSVRELLPRQIHIAVRGDGPVSRRELVPITPAARELLHGRHRDAAERVLKGMLAPLDAQQGASNFRGLSLSTDVAGFATNLLASNIEAGFEPDSVTIRDKQQFERTFTNIGRAVVEGGVKAQNTGWTDFGPRVSQQVLDLIARGEQAGRDTAAEVALTAAHELQHSHTAPLAPGAPRQLVWLEEGAAETLAWWPGVAAESMRRMGVPARRGEEPDPFVADPRSVASNEYRQRHRAVLGLLDLAGVQQRTETGTPSADAYRAATQLLQGVSIERVPRNLARAIARTHGLRAEDVPALADLIVESRGEPSAVEALRDVVAQAAAGSHSGA